MDLLEKAIKKTISYAKGFNCSFNEEEIKERLISKELFNDKKIGEGIKKYNKEINSNKNSIERVDGKFLQEKLKKAEKLSKWIEEKFKDITFLGISGSVASNYPKENDDIDLLIVTKRNRLWWTRLKLRFWIFAKKIPHRRFGKKEEKDQFCFNLWLDEEGLLLAKKKRNLQNGMDLIMMKVLINRDGVYEKFLLRNDWVKKFLVNGYEEKIKKTDKKILREIEDKNEISNKKNRLLNFLCFWPQYWYMNKRITQEIVNYHQAFFHS